MENKVLQTKANEQLRKKLYLAQYDYFDGDNIVTFNIIDINYMTKKITVAISNLGKITVETFDLKQTSGKKLYFFEYGYFLPEVIFIDDFRIAKEVI